MIDDSIIELRRKQKEEEAALNEFALNFVKSVLNSVILPGSNPAWASRVSLCDDVIPHYLVANHFICSLQQRKGLSEPYEPSHMGTLLKKLVLIILMHWWR